MLWDFIVEGSSDACICAGDVHPFVPHERAEGRSYCSAVSTGSTTSLLDVLLGMKPHPLASVRMDPSYRINKPSAVIHYEVCETVTGESIVALPLVCKEYCPRFNVCFDKPHQGVIISIVVITLNEEAFTRRSAISTEHPLSNSPSPSRLYLTNLLSSISMMWPGPPILLVADPSSKTSAIHCRSAL